MAVAAKQPRKRREYHTTRKVGPKAFCGCGGWGKPTGTETIDNGRFKIQRRKCEQCGSTFSITINLDE